MFEVTLNSEFAGVLKRELFENESEAYDFYYELEAEADKLTEMSLLNDQEDYHFAELRGDYNGN